MHKRIIENYYRLTKPGIIYANALTAVAGYLFGSAWKIDVYTFAAVVIGTSLVIAGACTYNNVLDRRIDTHMKRTKKRALVTGEITPLSAIIFATTLELIGFGLLIAYTNVTVVVIGLIGLIDYVILYGWAKRTTSTSTIVGSISGSTSIVAGYCAAAGRFDQAAFILFMILTLWQMPHFYAIAMYRRDDYAAAGLPLMPLQKSASTVKLRILAYVAGYIVFASLLTALGHAGIVSMLILVTLGAMWLIKGIRWHHLKTADWGKKMFLFSLIVNLGISFAVAVGSVTP